MESQLLASLKKVTLLQSSWTSVVDFLTFEVKGCHFTYFGQGLFFWEHNMSAVADPK
jgi:hypothetical protein